MSSTLEVAKVDDTHDVLISLWRTSHLSAELFILTRCNFFSDFSRAWLASHSHAKNCFFVATELSQHTWLIKVLHTKHVMVFTQFFGCQAFCTKFFYFSQSFFELGRHFLQVAFHAVDISHENRIGVTNLDFILNFGYRNTLNRAVATVLGFACIFLQLVTSHDQNICSRIR